MGQVLQRILQEARRQDRAALRVPASGLPLTGPRSAARSRRIRSALPIAVALALGGCSNPAIEKAAGQGAGAGIVVRTASDSLTIENHTTRPLLNIRVTVTAAGSDTPFVHVVPTIDADQAADVRLSDLTSESGTILDAGMNAPQSATVIARDTLGNTYGGRARW
jgi:hypothetical protein